MIERERQIVSLSLRERDRESLSLSRTYINQQKPNKTNQSQCNW